MKVCTTCGKEWPDETKFCPNDGSTLRSAARTADLVGSIIADRYHIKKKLGEGGMGAVYLGEHVKMGRMSAIKVMTQSMANDPDAIARFNREAANASRINHANVCAIYDFGETPDGLIYLAMEFIEGEALTDLLKREGALRPDRAANILKQCTDGLQAAHDLGIVHRDIKPDNIMVTKARDGSDLVKVVDFGIAKAVGGEEGQNVTKTGLVVGTPEYMSPEQLSGDVLDGRSDLYSIALVLFRMLTGGLPFRADTAQETMIKRLTDQPMKLNQVVQGTAFPPNLQTAMDKALARMPSERFVNADEFGKAVAAAVSGADFAPTPADDDATQLIDAGGVAATAQATAQMVPQTGVAGAEPRAPTPDTPQPVPQPLSAEKKKSSVGLIAAGFIFLAGASITVFVVMGGDSGEVSVDPSTTENATAETQPVAQQATARTPSGGGGTGGQQTENALQTQTPSQQNANPPGQQDRVVGGGGEGGPTPITPANPIFQPVDSTEIDAQLFNILDAIDGSPSTNELDSLRRQAMRIHDNPRVPDNLKAQAAQMVADMYFTQNNLDGSCLWIDKALDIMPGRDAYQSLKNMYRCS
ncbi:MAG: serine/threonine-protein kinase [Gemmatimonadetes bacterium]|nr:serine/threonine-protein kinase [Gemmatimonadota bacterium]